MTADVAASANATGRRVLHSPSRRRRLKITLLSFVVVIALLAIAPLLLQVEARALKVDVAKFDGDSGFFAVSERLDNEQQRCFLSSLKICSAT